MRAFFAGVFPENPLNLFFLLLFVGIFCGVVWFNLRASRKPDHDKASKLPLND